ncbi:hypothetical protein IT575_05080 [bacterium]|nr:hypothetical protein [bacterium]
MYRIYLWVAAVSVACAALMFSACMSQAQQSAPFAIAFNFDTSGYLETCGCSAHQLGGLGRRATKLEELRQKQPLLALEGAHIVADKGSFQLFKGQIIVASLNAMGYSGLQLGVREAQQGKADMAKLIEGAKFPCFSANLLVDRAAWPTGSFVTEVAGNKIGVTGVSQPELTKEIEMPAEMAFANPEDALEGALASLEAQKVQCLVVCLEGNYEWVEAISTKYKDRVDIFLSGDRNAGTAKLDFKNDPPRMNVFDKGRFMGLLTVDPVFRGGASPAAYNVSGTSVKLGDHLADAEPIKAILDNDYKPRLKEMFFDVFKAELPQLFMPPEYCADCHKREYETYMKTGHAIAMKTLEDKGQLYNPDCMKCHLTYDPREDKIYSMGCVTCHTNITDDHVWQAMEGKDKVVIPETPVTTYTHDWCYRCHDPLNSSEFEAHWPQYINKIYHGGDMSEAEQAAKEMGINIKDPPPAH